MCAEDPVLMTLAPRKKPVAIFTRAPTMMLWLPEVVPDIVEEAPPVAPAPPPPAPPPPAPPPAAPLLALATKLPTEQLVMPTRKTGWVDDSSQNLGPAPEETTATPPATALPSVAAWASSSMEAEQAAKVWRWCLARTGSWIMHGSWIIKLNRGSCQEL